MIKRYAAELMSLRHADKLSSEDRDRRTFLESMLHSEPIEKPVSVKPRVLKEMPSVGEALANIDKAFNKK